MKGHGAKYPHKREQAIIALLSHSSIGQAAKTAGISEVTLWRWIKDQEFQQAYREAKRRVVDQAISRLQQVCGEAVETLREIMTDPEKPTSSRVTAARAILEMAVKAVEIDDLASRVEKLERTIESNY